MVDTYLKFGFQMRMKARPAKLYQRELRHSLLTRIAMSLGHRYLLHLLSRLQAFRTRTKVRLTLVGTLLLLLGLLQKGSVYQQLVW
jgi:hypothetical protein